MLFSLLLFLASNFIPVLGQNIEFSSNDEITITLPDLGPALFLALPKIKDFALDHLAQEIGDITTLRSFSIEDVTDDYSEDKGDFAVNLDNILPTVMMSLHGALNTDYEKSGISPAADATADVGDNQLEEVLSRLLELGKNFVRPRQRTS